MSCTVTNDDTRTRDGASGARYGIAAMGVSAILMTGCVASLEDPNAYEEENPDLLTEYAADDTDPDAVVDEEGAVWAASDEAREIAFDMDDEDLSADFNDRETLEDMIAVANLDTFHLDEVELAEEAAWDETHTAQLALTREDGEEPLDRGEGPAVRASHARGSIIRVDPHGTVVGWACDRRNPNFPVVALVTVRNDDGIRMREAVLADQEPVPTWARRWIRERCGDTTAHLFRLQLDGEIGCANAIGLTLVGHRDRQRYFVRRRQLRCSPIGNVTNFNVRDRELRAITGWACDQERPEGQVVVSVHSSRSGRLRHRRTDVHHGREVHVRCLGGQRHRFRYELDRRAPQCGTTETIRVYAHNIGDRGADRVLIGKRTIRGGSCAPGGYGNDYSSGAPTWGGCRYVTNEVVGIVAANGGYGVTSRKRTETFGNPSSDHYVGNTLSDAVDFATANNYRLAQIIRSRLAGGTHADYASFTFRRDGHTFRGQLIAGTHGTGPHLHFGCQRID